MSYQEQELEDMQDLFLDVAAVCIANPNDEESKGYFKTLKECIEKSRLSTRITG